MQGGILCISIRWCGAGQVDGDLWPGLVCILCLLFCGNTLGVNLYYLEQESVMCLSLAWREILLGVT